MMMIYVYHTYLINIDEDDYYDDGYGEEDEYYEEEKPQTKKEKKKAEKQAKKQEKEKQKGKSQKKKLLDDYLIFLQMDAGLNVRFQFSRDRCFR